jgi:hypothetical protein
MGDGSTRQTGPQVKGQDEAPGEGPTRCRVRQLGPTRTRTCVIETDVVIVAADGTEEPFDRAALLG